MLRVPFGRRCQNSRTADCSVSNRSSLGLQQSGSLRPAVQRKELVSWEDYTLISERILISDSLLTLSSGFGGQKRANDGRARRQPLQLQDVMRPQFGEALHAEQLHRSNDLGSQNVDR